MVKKDLYEILGVSRQGKTVEIRRAYLKLARRLHPDVNPGDREAHLRYREIQEAYRVLSRRQSRDPYDRKGETEPPSGKGGRRGAGKRHSLDSKGWEGIVRDVFHNDAEGESESGSSRGEDIHHVLEVSFEESLKGAKRDVSFQRDVVCPSCRGRRFAPGAEIHDCPECAGDGLVLTRKGPYSVRQICRRCVGTGEASDQPCRACSGRGVALPGGSKKGDFYVTVKVVVPQATDPRARSLFLELAKLFPGNPRVKT